MWCIFQRTPQKPQKRFLNPRGYLSPLLNWGTYSPINSLDSLTIHFDSSSLDSGYRRKISVHKDTHRPAVVDTGFPPGREDFRFVFRGAITSERAQLLYRDKEKSVIFTNLLTSNLRRRPSLNGKLIWKGLNKKKHFFWAQEKTEHCNFQ